MRTRLFKLIRFSSCLIVLVLLQGCTNVAMTGAQAAYNHRNIQKQVKDQYITMQAFKKLNIDDKRFKNTNISIATYNRRVLLAGQAPESWQRDQAEQIVKEIPDVEKVYNLVSIGVPSSTIKRISDSWLTAKVKAKLIASNQVDASQIKVVTENGTVYLMGTIWPEEAKAAAEVASKTGGVERVVKIFSYLQEKSAETETG